MYRFFLSQSYKVNGIAKVGEEEYNGLPTIKFILMERKHKQDQQHRYNTQYHKIKIHSKIKLGWT